MRVLGVRSALLVVLLFVACNNEMEATDAGPAPTDAGPGEVEEDPLRADCDALVDKFCAFPFPSDYWLVDDATTASGHRIALGATTLPLARVRFGTHVDPTAFNRRDGWSINGSILALIEGATATGLPAPNNIGRSLEDDSPTVLLDAETGTRVPHWSEIDATPEEDHVARTFIIRPAVPLQHNTRYLVAIRNVVDDRGEAVPPSETFAALRDGNTSPVPSIEAWREHFESIFTTLDGYGVERDSLQLAWDFTTSSLEDDTRWLLSVRDQALAIVGDAGPSFTIDEDGIEEFTEAENPHTARRIYGHMTVPNFMTTPNAGALLNLGADGMPEQNGTAEYRFVVNIPRSATPATPAQPLQYGHGLFGAYTQANAGWLSQFGNENGFVTFGVDWLGMSEEDVLPLTLSLVNGRLHEFQTIAERLVQGIVNALLAMRMMLGGFAQHELVTEGGQSIIDTSAGFYTGDSQGGIFGGTYMAITTDVRRGVLGVPGQPYSLLLNRSVDFDPYRDALTRSLGDGPPVQLGQVLLQQLWDRTEPGSYTSHIRTDLFPGTPAHEVLLQPAIGDHQVTTLGAHVMARAIGARTIEPAVRPIWGITPYTVDDQTTMGPFVGSAITEFDFGLNEPVENIPVDNGDDPHGAVRKNPEALAQSLHFFRTGEIIPTCDGPCDPH